MVQVYLNGEFVPVEEATISVLDRGFLFGDGVYEVIPVFSGQPLQEQEHLERLYRSLSAIDLKCEPPEGGWQKLFTQLLSLNQDDGPNQAIYLQITRGAATKRAHAYPADVKPTVFVMPMPFAPNITGMDEADQLYPSGKAITVIDKRWQRCDIKSTSLLGNLMPHHKASEAGVNEAIQIDSQGWVTEGSSSNVFVVQGESVVTPPLSDSILGGITRALVVELVTRDGRYTCEERELSAVELQRADEIWITSASKEILPITELDGASVGTGAPGPVWKHVAALYQHYRDSDRAPETNCD